MKKNSKFIFGAVFGLCLYVTCHAQMQSPALQDEPWAFMFAGQDGLNYDWEADNIKMGPVVGQNCFVLKGADNDFPRVAFFDQNYFFVASESYAGPVDGAGARPVFRIRTAKLIQSARVQTDSQGNFTWTFPVAYALGTVVKVSALPEGDMTKPINVQLVGQPTTTSATFKVLTLPSTSILSIVVLGAPTGAQVYLHLIASN